MPPLCFLSFYVSFACTLAGLLFAAVSATERAPLMHPGPLSDGQFYSPPESVAGQSPCG